MKILYFGTACDEEWFKKICEQNVMPYQVAQYNFETALIDGFSNNKEINLDINYIYQGPVYPNSLFLKLKKGKRRLNKKYYVNYYSNINIQIIKDFVYFLKVIYHSAKWAIEYKNDEKKIILTGINYLPMDLALFLVAKLFKLKRANVFTDLTSDILSEKRQRKISWYKRLLYPLFLKLTFFLEKSYDFYILFTKEMNNLVNPNKKPYLVMEGIYNNKLVVEDVSLKEKKQAIMYAGTLSFEYGVKNLIDAFELIDEEEIELWLFGDGDMKEYISKICQRNNKVKYFGFKPHNEVFEYEKKAKLLINTRNPDDDYTKYSFPSKTFEYMLSGTPFLTTKLSGIPVEYYKYIFTLEDNEVESIRQKINEILKLPQVELNEMGVRAQKFILDNKNSLVQAEKIINSIEQILTNQVIKENQ